ncbi:MAG: hypothetical protein RSC76_09580, partial [Oscillospiraceae bacterium]
VVCGGFRFADFFLFFDAESGFLRDNGFLSYIGLAVIAAVFVTQFIIGLKNRKNRFAYQSSPGFARGICSLAAALAALLATWFMYVQHEQQALSGVREFSATGLSVRFPFMIVTGVLALYLLFAAALHVLGQEWLFQKWELLELIPVLWGLLFVLYVFIHYSVSFLISENIFVVTSACALTLCLLNKAKYLSGIVEQGKTLGKLSLMTSLALMLIVAYTCSNFVLFLFGIVYVGDLPLEVQLVILLLEINAAGFLFTSHNKEIPILEIEEHPGKRFK